MVLISGGNGTFSKSYKAKGSVQMRGKRKFSLTLYQLASNIKNDEQNYISKGSNFKLKGKKNSSSNLFFARFSVEIEDLISEGF